MKKLIVFSVVLALVAGVAFAQPSVGGQLKAGVTLFSGSTAEGDDDVMAGGRLTGGGVTNAYVNVRAGDADLGAFARLHGRSDGDYYSPDAFAFVWWKPIEQLRLQFGRNPDGDFGTARITGWGYNSEAQDYVAIDQDSNEWAWASSGYGSFDVIKGARGYGFLGGQASSQALNVSITPVDDLAINIHLPFGNDMEVAKDLYLKLAAQFTYTLDAGRLAVSYKGKGEDKGGDLYASFYVSAIDNLGLDIGLNYTLAGKNEKDQPIKIGFGAAYADGDFGVKFRFGGALAGDDKATTLSFGVLPYYNLGSLTAFLNAGFGMWMPDAGDNVTSWFVNPYIAVPVGGAKFFAGLKVFSWGWIPDSKGNEYINWALPIGINYYF